jgi:hypothetical protein
MDCLKMNFCMVQDWPRMCSEWKDGSWNMRKRAREECGCGFQEL